MARVQKILYVNHVSQVSGAENSLLALLGALDRKRFQPILACPAGGDLSSRAGAMGVEVRCVALKRLYRTANPFRLLGNTCHLALIVRRLKRLIETEGVCIIHANSTTAQIYASIAGRLSGVPSIWHARDLVRLGWIGRAIYRMSDRIIATSGAVATCLAPSGQSDARMVIVHNGIDVESFRKNTSPGRIRKELGLSGSKKVVTMIGQIIPWKGHRAFITAISKLQDVTALVVGDDLFGDHPGLAGSLQALCRDLKIEDRVLFLGWRDDVKDILADSDVLAIPSEAEPFGRVALEAMALAKPVVGTKAGGLPEIVSDGETGVLVPPGDADGLARGIGSLLDDPRRAEAAGRAGLERVRSHFNIKTCARQIERIYEDLLES